MAVTVNPLYRAGEFLGLEARTESCHYFFGGASCDKERLGELFPHYEFRFLRQVHGRELVESTLATVEADAHWTTDRHVALAIQTADCMPVLMGASNLVLAAHAGWRGVENGLLLRCGEFLGARATSVEGILIGPHIQAAEFEVGNDVADLLKRASPLTDVSQFVLRHPQPEKSYVNLSRIAIAQMHASLQHPHPIYVAPESTLSDTRFQSYRRGNAKAARQYSFIAKT